ncbi:hypothetical protein D9M71_381130 [compost metagenome]
MQVLGHGARAPWFGQRLGNLVHRLVRQQVEQQHPFALTVDGLAHRRRPGIHQATFHTLRGENELTLARRAAGYAEGNVLQWCTGEFVREQRAPACHFKTAVAGLQRRDIHSPFGQQRLPATVGAEPCPAAATQSQYHDGSVNQAFALWISNPQGTLGIPAQPAMAGVDNYPTVAQALEPGTQQRCGFHVGGEHPARGADEGFDAQTMNPLAQRVSIEVA